MKIMWTSSSSGQFVLFGTLFLMMMMMMMTTSALQVQVHPGGGSGHHHHRNSPSENAQALSFVSSLLPGVFQTGSNSEGRSLLSAVATILPMFMSQRDDESSTSIPFNITDLLRMVGVDSNKIGTMVINAIVYVIEMVSNHFFGGGSNTIDGRKLDSPGSFLLFLFDTKRAESFIKRISDPEVPNNIISNLQKVSGNDTICIQQLICKMAPFWWGVNQSVRDLIPLGKKTQSNLPNIGWTSLLKKYVPSIQEFSTNSDVCEARFPGCIVVTYNNNNNVNNKKKNV